MNDAGAKIVALPRHPEYSRPDDGGIQTGDKQDARRGRQRD